MHEGNGDGFFFSNNSSEATISGLQPSTKEEDNWHTAMRERVAAYLHRTGVVHGAVGEVPAWEVFPVASVWAIKALELLVGSAGG
jgi:hypothetical protein